MNQHVYVLQGSMFRSELEHHGEMMFKLTYEHTSLHNSVCYSAVQRGHTFKWKSHK